MSLCDKKICYVLLLYNSLLNDYKIYIGITTNLYKRLRIHFNSLSQSSKIIKSGYKPIYIIDIIPNANYKTETLLTRQYIKWNTRKFVYGSHYCCSPRFDSIVKNRIRYNYMNK